MRVGFVPNVPSQLRTGTKIGAGHFIASSDNEIMIMKKQ